MLDEKVSQKESENLSFETVSISYPSEWYCELFGLGQGMVLNPGTVNIPNRFWRVMQYLVLGNKWIKRSK